MVGEQFFGRGDSVLSTLTEKQFHRPTLRVYGDVGL